MQKADRWTGVLVALLGLGVTFEAWRMPRFTEFGTQIWSAPGIVPGLIGIALAVMGVLLALRSPRPAAAAAAAGTQHADVLAEAQRGAGRADETRASRTGVALAFGLCMAFAAGLVGRIPFELATFVFVAAFILIFDARDRRGAPRRRVLRAGAAVAVAAVAAVAISTVFRDVFFVRLP